MKERKIMLSAIAAMAQNRVIGKDNALIWHIPEDLKYFKRTTLGKPIIMGRKSYEALGKPLPGRANIVISRSHSLPQINENGPFCVSAIDEAITLGKQKAQETGAEEIFITGGGEIYKQTLNRLDKLYLTLLHRDYEGDTHFPAFDWKDWETLSEEKQEGDPAYTFFILKPR